MDEDSVLEMLNSSLAFSLAESLCFSGPVSPAGCGNRIPKASREVSTREGPHLRVPSPVWSGEQPRC